VRYYSQKLVLTEVGEVKVTITTLC